MFFRRHGFLATKLLRKYYEDSGEDAYQMELRAPAYEQLEEFADAPVNRIAQYEEN
jgi:ribosomal-protein-alanine N-acetyltransferase